MKTRTRRRVCSAVCKTASLLLAFLRVYAMPQQQVEWLRYFNDAERCAGGIIADVVHVEETES